MSAGDLFIAPLFGDHGPLVEWRVIFVGCLTLVAEHAGSEQCFSIEAARRLAAAGVPDAA